MRMCSEEWVLLGVSILGLAMALVLWFGFGMSW